MPTINLTVPKAAWSKEEKGEIVTRLTDALAAYAKEAGKGDIKQYVSVHVNETAEGGYAIGGNVFG